METLASSSWLAASRGGRRGGNGRLQKQWQKQSTPSISSSSSLLSLPLLFLFAWHSFTSYLLFLLLLASSSSSLRLPLRHVSESIPDSFASSDGSLILERGRRHVSDTFDVLDVEDPSLLHSSSSSPSSAGIFSLRGKPGLGYYVAMSLGRYGTMVHNR